MDSDVFALSIGPVGTIQTLGSTSGVPFLKTSEIWMSLFQVDSGIWALSIGSVGTIQTLRSTSVVPFLKNSESFSGGFMHFGS